MKNELKLDNNFTLSNNKNQWILTQQVESKDIHPKSKKTKDVWYCGNLNNALSRYINESTKPAKDVSELKSLLTFALERIYELTKNR